jgi:tRNA modification GTPase
MSSTIATRLTGSLAAAIATLAIRGPQAESLVRERFRSPGGAAVVPDVDEVRFGNWSFLDPRTAPEQAVLCRTAVDAFELHTHGGVALCDSILSDLSAMGCEIIAGEAWHLAEVQPPALRGAVSEKGDTADRGRLSQSDPLSAGAALPLIQASTLGGATLLLHQYRGALTRAVLNIVQQLETGSVDAATVQLESLIERGERARLLLGPPKLTFGGPPNVGKSSLTNALVGSTRVLVHAEAGTTRDSVDTEIVVGGWPLLVTDTAGVRDTSDPIELQGVIRARQRWLTADLGLLVVDATCGWTETHARMLEERLAEPRPEGATKWTWIVLNKCDLAATDTTAAGNFAEQLAALTGNTAGNTAGTELWLVKTRATGADGVAELLAELARWLERWVPDGAAGVPYAQVHLDAFYQVRLDLACGRPEAGLSRLRQLLGLGANG